MIISSKDLGSAMFSCLGLPEFPSVKWAVDGLNETMDVAEASKVNYFLCHSGCYLPGAVGGLSSPLCQAFSGLSVQVGPAATGSAHLLPPANKAE